MNVVQASRTFVQTLVLSAIVLSLSSSLHGGVVNALEAVEPGLGEAFADLLPYEARRTNPLQDRGTDWLSDPTEATAGKLSPGFSQLESGLESRAPYCVDPGYGLCPDKDRCCPLGGLCCNNGGCCYKGYRCCSFRGCCTTSTYCTVIDGVKGCCPNGKICTLSGRKCVDSGYVHCKNFNFCCRPGYTCARNSKGDDICIPPSNGNGGSDDDDDDYTTIKTTTRVIVETTSTTIFNTLASSSTPPPASSSSRAADDGDDDSEDPDFDTDALDNASSSAANGQGNSTETSSSARSTANSVPNSQLNSSSRSFGLGQALLLLGLAATAWIAF